MPPPNISPHVSREANIHLAVSALKKNQIQTERRAAATFNVSRATLHRRRAGRPARRDCQPNSKKLTKLEEEVIANYILNLDLRRFSPTYAAMRNIASKLLATCGAS